MSGMPMKPTLPNTATALYTWAALPFILKDFENTQAAIKRTAYMQTATATIGRAEITCSAVAPLRVFINIISGRESFIMYFDT